MRTPRIEVGRFHPRLDLLGAEPPLGPLQLDSSISGFQCPPCRPRSRDCLLEGCPRRFRPCCARRYYCSEACREAARRWSQQQAQEKYRASEKGKACRREQSRRYRERCRQRRKCSGNGSASRWKTACEGHHQDSPGPKICCHRPGCYNRFVISSRSPLQRFCSSLCREALRAARTIQRRWQEGCAECPRAGSVDRLLPGRGW